MRGSNSGGGGDDRRRKRRVRGDNKRQSEQKKAEIEKYKLKKHLQIVLSNYFRHTPLTITPISLSGLYEGNDRVDSVELAPMELKAFKVQPH